MILQFLKALAAGVYASLPIGPVGAVVIERSLKSGFRSGMRVGLGSACAHGIFAVGFIFGLSKFSIFFSGQYGISHIIGGTFLLFFGFFLLFRKHVVHTAETRRYQKAGEFGAGFLLTITNPNQLATYTIILTFLGKVQGSLQKSLVVVGIFIGAVLTWAVVSGLITKYRSHITQKSQSMVRKLIGLVMLGVGTSLLVGAF